MGGNWREYRNGVAYGGIDTPYPIDVHNFNPHSIPEPASPASQGYFASRYRQTGEYVSGRFSLANPLTLVLGTRLGNYRTDGNPAQIVHNHFTSYAGLVLDIGRSYSLYASYADIFRAQNGQTITGDLLTPVTGADYEAGLKGEFYEGRLNFFRGGLPGHRKKSVDGGSVASVRHGGRARMVQRPPGPGTQPGIRDRIERQAGAGMGAVRRVHVQRDDLREERSATGAGLQHVYAQASIQAVDGVSPAGDAQPAGALAVVPNAQSAFYVVDGAVRLQQGSYVLANARLGYRINDHFDVAVNGINLFDRTYWQTFSTATGANYYGEPRNVMLRPARDLVNGRRAVVFAMTRGCPHEWRSATMSACHLYSRPTGSMRLPYSTRHEIY